MARLHPADCTCNCHADPGEKRMEAVFLQKDDPALRRCFSHAILVGFMQPNGLRCRDCGQYYGYDPVTDALRPIEGNHTSGPHPDIPHWLASANSAGWRQVRWLTPDFAPEWLHRKIYTGTLPTTWEIVTRWTMDH